MPTVNIYASTDPLRDHLLRVVHELREFIATQLSCSERTLEPDEVTIRLMSVNGTCMIASIELDIVAHPYEERRVRMDETCNTVRLFVMERIPIAKDVRVWLSLAELGHSWELTPT